MAIPQVAYAMYSVGKGVLDSQEAKRKAYAQLEAANSVPHERAAQLLADPSWKWNELTDNEKAYLFQMMSVEGADTFRENLKTLASDNHAVQNVDKIITGYIQDSANAGVPYDEALSRLPPDAQAANPGKLKYTYDYTLAENQKLKDLGATKTAQAQANGDAVALTDLQTNALARGDALTDYQASQELAAPQLQAAQQYEDQALQYTKSNAELTDYLWKVMRGETPSSAEQQLYAGLAHQQAGIQSNAQTLMGQGESAGLANYLASQQGLAAEMQTNQQAGVLRAQESQTAAGQIGTANQTSGQLMAGLAQNRLNQGTQQQNIYANLVGAHLSSGTALDVAQLNAKVQMAGFNMQAKTAEEQMANQRILQQMANSGALSAAEANRAFTLYGALIGASATILASGSGNGGWLSNMFTPNTTDLTQQAADSLAPGFTEGPAITTWSDTTSGANAAIENPDTSGQWTY